MTQPDYIVPCSPWHLLFLCERMRADEIEQYLALTGAAEFKPDVAALGMANMAAAGPSFTIVAEIDGANVPVVSGGFTEVIPGVWSSWMVGSKEGWDLHWRKITKGTLWVFGFMFETMQARRLQTNALASREAACWWYERSLKMQPEGIWARFGRNGEDVACFARLAPAPLNLEAHNGQRE